MPDPADAPNPQDAAPADATATPPADPPATETPVDHHAGALAALEEGLKSEDPPPSDPPPADDPPDDPPPPETPPADGEPPPADAPPPAEPDAADVEAESLGISKNEKANARFKELYNTAKEVPALREKAQEFDTMIQHVEATGATPEQYGTALGYLHAINNGGPEQWAQAREALIKEVAFLDQKLGRPASGDILEAHPDLAAEVHAGDLTRPRAEEIANQRSRQQANERWQQERNTATQAQQEAVQTAVGELNSIGTQLAQRDPHFAAKREAAIAKFKERQHQVHPSRWAAEFLLDYQTIPNPAPAPTPPAPPPVGHVPLRSRGGTGAVAKVPTSPLEALNAGLDAHAKGLA